MRKKVGIIAAALLAVVLYSCSSDIVLQAPEGIEGSYLGTYTIIQDEDTVGVQNVSILFNTDGDWVMGVDTTNPTDFCICRSFGQFDVSDRLRLVLDEQKSVVPEGVRVTGTDTVECTSCGYDDRPDGTFQLVRTESLLILSQSATLNDGSVVQKRFELQEVVP